MNNFQKSQSRGMLKLRFDRYFYEIKKFSFAQTKFVGENVYLYTNSTRMPPGQKKYIYSTKKGTLEIEIVLTPKIEQLTKQKQFPVEVLIFQASTHTIAEIAFITARIIAYLKNNFLDQNKT